jgi:hypothetical protein
MALLLRKRDAGAYGSRLQARRLQALAERQLRAMQG